MGKIITSADIYKLKKAGIKELVLNEGDLLTDLCREILSREGIKVVKSPAAGYTAGLSEHPRQGSNELQQEKAVLSAGHKFDLAIANGTVIIPEFGAISANIGIRDGKVASIGTDSMEAEKTVDATGLLVLPGIIDPHSHMGLFAPLETDLYTETQSAILGGVTTIGCFFNQTGSYLPLLRRLESLVPRRSSVDLFPHLTIRDEEQLQEIDQYVQEGITSFKMYMCGIPGLFPAQEDGFIVKVLETLKRLPEKTLMCVHAENTSIVEYASTEDRLQSVETLAEWAKTHPDLAEGEAINRAIYFSNKLDFPIYVVHVSSKDGVEVIRNNSFRKGTIETTSPYLTIDQEDDIAAKGKMLPPLRDRASRDSLWEALENGYIDTIGTDNTTLTLKEKQAADGMANAIAGYPALGVHLVSVLNEAIKRGVPLEKVIPLMTMNPAKTFGVYPAKGTLLPGSDADLVLVDPNLSKKVDPSLLASRSDFALHEGKTLRCWPCCTVKAGRIVAWNGRLTENLSSGSVIKRKSNRKILNY